MSDYVKGSKTIKKSKYERYYVYPKGSNVNVRSGFSTDTDILINVPGNICAGQIIGFYHKKVKGYKWYGILLSKPVKDRKAGCVREDVISMELSQRKGGKTSKVTEKDAKTVVENLIDSDIKIYKRLLVISELLNRTEKKGYNVDKQRKVLHSLILRYGKRQAKLKSATASLKVQGYINTAYDWLKGKFGLGVLPLIPIAVGAVVGGAITVSLYFYFRPSYDESEQDLKITGKFKDFLMQLPDDTRKEIITDLEKQIDDAYGAGLTRGKFSGMFSILKWPIIIIAGVWGTAKAFDVVEKWKKKK